MNTSSHATMHSGILSALYQQTDWRRSMPLDGASIASHGPLRCGARHSLIRLQEDNLTHTRAEVHPTYIFPYFYSLIYLVQEVQKRGEKATSVVYK